MALPVKQVLAELVRPDQQHIDSQSRVAKLDDELVALKEQTAECQSRRAAEITTQASLMNEINVSDTCAT